MKKAKLIIGHGFQLLKLAPGTVALYIVLSFVTQTLIPVALLPRLLAQVTNSVSLATRSSTDTNAAGNKTGDQTPEMNGAPKPAVQSRAVEANRAETSTARHLIVYPYFGWLVLILALIPLNIFFRLSQTDLDNRMEFEMRTKIFANVLRQPPEFFRNYNPGQLSSILTQMTTQAQYAFRTLTIEPAMQLVSLSIATLLIVRELQKMSGPIVWPTVIAVVLIGFLTVYLVQLKAQDAVSRCQVDLQQQMLEVAGMATSMASAPQDIQVMNAEPLFGAKYSRAVSNMFQMRRNQVSTMEAVNSLLGFPTQLILGCLFGFVVYAVVSGRPGTDPGSIVALSYLVPQLMEPFKTFAALGLTASSTWPAVELITQLSEQTSRINDSPGSRDIDQVTPTLEARNLTFRYEPGLDKIFDNVSFEVPPGKITGLVGRFGSGKTTFFRLALRLYDPQEGQILLGGYTTNQFTLHSLRQQISMMSQNPNFFHDTVRENFRMFKPDVSDEEIRSVAAKTGLWPILVRLFGKDPLKEPFAAGASLSGGQKRLFSLTCSLIRNSTFLFLDEPTTGLSADEIWSLVPLMRQACEGKTVVVVDHILPSFIVPFCDHVLVLDEGRIVASGSPQELLTQRGLFSQLHEMQLAQTKSGAVSADQPS
jgi:ABC-type multidrug transport system fused ATPase/permease subunit